mmetsp:Transcript_21127/g.48285  ORF Transcript_21127/g.48285 Transcript_21127/m.48285 type:complete len:295 (-) Transcript_21127:122-1006(-)|eukprot:CAMPEP_0197942072 /NCGR_PEP_ID=MMETSP1439-20131203/123784_1 /TAXON_ID=66791 /ORGANISM="Gonyaulax spinifera, Strain CCMP409" /LENGTH=294 /DNA_ID=CAMNT_0043565309 /DNA_START=24 /DNA_END=908 /DNA_ORIENTATION=-
MELASLGPKQRDEEPRQPLATAAEPAPARGHEGQAAGGARRQRKLQVTWDKVDGACAELLLFQANKPDAGVPLQQQDPEPESPGFFTVVCSTVSDFCSALRDLCCALDDDEDDEQGRMKGDLWKLNSGPASTMEGLNSLENWRRRLFCLLRSQGRIVLTYISEKENGMVHLASVLLDNWGAIAEVEALPTVDMEPLSEESMKAVQFNLQDYDIAFVQPRRRRMDDYYRSMVPKRLYPFAIRWTDAEGVKRSTVLATHQRFYRNDWLQAIRQLLPGIVVAGEPSTAAAADLARQS